MRLILFISAITLGIQSLPISTEPPQADETERYYWRDFHGYIPHDALKAGTDINGKSVYIGQVLHNGILIPGKITTGDKELSFEWGHTEYKSDKNIKILSTPHPEQYEWIKTDLKGIRNLNKKFITGGYEPGNGEITYIGKTRYEGADDVGKLLINDNEYGGLYTTKDGKGIQHEEFEALAYNPKVPIILVNKASEDENDAEKDTETHNITSDKTCGPRIININID